MEKQDFASQSQYNVWEAKIVCRVKIMILVSSAEIHDVRIWVTFPLSQMMAAVQKNPRGLGSQQELNTIFSTSLLGPQSHESFRPGVSNRECYLWIRELGLLCDPNSRKPRQLNEPSWGLSRLPQNRKRSWRAGACKRQEWWWPSKMLYPCFTLT